MEHPYVCVVLACKHRKALVLPHLVHAGITFVVCNNIDHSLPDDIRITDDRHNQKHRLGAYRCYMGHQCALALADMLAPRLNTLVLEDDAIPGVSNWREIVDAADEELDRDSSLGVISLHGRSMLPSQFRPQAWLFGREMWYGEHGAHALGSLAYLIKPAARADFLRSTFCGTPVDWHLFNYPIAVVEPSPFMHNRSERSLVEQPA